MPDWLNKIQSSLTANGHTALLWGAGDGGLLVTVHAARILACHLPGVPGNLFWHAPALADAASAKRLLDAREAPGGDRLWIAPEVAFNWPDLGAARLQPFGENYKLPAAMDPADWRIVENQPGHLQLTTQMTLMDHRVEKSITLRVGRQLDVIDRPAALAKSVRCASYTIRNDLTILSGDKGAVAGAWGLLQVPLGGVLVCPTVTPVRQPTRYYDSFRAKDIKCDKTSVRMSAHGDRIIKMGLSPTQTTGRMAYVRRAGKLTTAIVRFFLPVPGAPYVDVPRSSDGFLGGDALQAFCDDGCFGGFAEMEYHEPGLIAGEALSTRSGVSVTHVLAGPHAAVRKAVADLIGIKI
jgi:hypothetical protein